MNTTMFGLRAIIEAINSGSTINKVYLQKGLRGNLFFELESLIKKNKIATSFVPVERSPRVGHLDPGRWLGSRRGSSSRTATV